MLVYSSDVHLKGPGGGIEIGKEERKRSLRFCTRYYINYKIMKKKLRQYVEQTQNGGKGRQQVLKDFSKMLDDQIEKILLFLLEQQRLLANRIEKLGERWSNLLEHPDISQISELHEAYTEIEKIVLFLLEQQGLLANRIEKLGERRSNLLEHPDISQISELHEAYREVGRDLVKLLKFVDLNATGIRKILKKFDKRFGYRFTDYYVTSRSNHPYSQLQQVFKHVGIGAVVGALSRNLVDLQHHRGSYLSIYDQPSDALKDPVIDMIKASVDKLTHSTNFLQFLGKHALIMQEDVPSSAEDEVDETKYHFVSLLLNLANTFLYMVNTYVIVPTADDYSISLGAAPTVCGVIIGSMAIAQVFSSVYFSAWSNRSYFKPLIFSGIVLILGNVLYALAYDLESITVLLVGRVFCGLGSARAVNRRYISDCVPLKTRMQASAGFVSASALGMACGPALAGLLQTNFKIYSLTINQDTLPGWVMALAWLLYLIWLGISFREPVHDNREKTSSQDGTTTGRDGDDGLESGLAQPLLLGSEDNENEEEEECDESEEASEDCHKPANSIGSAYRLLTPAVKVFELELRQGEEERRGEKKSELFSLHSHHGKLFLLLTQIGEDSPFILCFVEISPNLFLYLAVIHLVVDDFLCIPRVQLLIYFMLKFGMEILLSESSVITAYYFNWTTSSVALFLAILGLTVLPVNAIVGTYLSNMFEDRKILLASEILMLVGVALSFHVTRNYTVAQYVCSALITFVSAEVLEGINLSLLSQVMSSRLSRGTYNGGLLSTEAGTLARVAADGAITLAGYLGESKLLNVTLLPALLICIVSIAATILTFNSLF
ncbi:SPX domain-containing membrane protein [Apostasia shenzhenica]|uniref:SPX domain-containing membrane protein n=1 Tax=Apostasia shenzhenica TaxID=1088818 RepID=A0A2I0AZ67_9ASPA|nr:SPX domain-containing membrane protein [Apostasia shenzhenica]